MINKNNFMGLDGFVWWFGVVENRQDPLMLGRCQVRVFGWHTENKTQIPTLDLPWAHPIVPLGSNAASMVAPKEGEMVFGFFLDGDDAQFPVMLGVVPGIPDGTPRIDKGFSDPRDENALKLAPKLAGIKTYSEDGSGVTYLDYDPPRFPNAANQPTVSPLARNENIENTIISERKQTTVKNVLTASEANWSEPTTKYDAKYPYNHVYETESGHVMEFDDTPGAERIHLAHRSGTFDEMFPDGSRVSKVVRSKYEIVMSDDNVYIMGDCNITVNGKAAVFVRGNADLKVGGNMKTSVQGTYEVVSTGNMKFVAPRIDLNPSGESPVYREQPYSPQDAVVQKRQVIGGTGSFEFAGVTMNVSPNYVGSVPGFYDNGKPDVPPGPPPQPAANVPDSPPVTCGDFSEPLTEADYTKNLSPSFKLRDITIVPNARYRINAQKGWKESEIACNLQALAENVFEPLKKQFGTFRINSGFRLGEDQGQHGTGEAADLSFKGGTDRKFLLEVVLWIKNNLKYDQLIYEVPEIGSGNQYFASAWLHVSYKRKGKNRTLDAEAKNLTYRGHGETYYKQVEIPWEAVTFITDPRDNSIRPDFSKFAQKPTVSLAAAQQRRLASNRGPSG